MSSIHCPPSCGRCRTDTHINVSFTDYSMLHGRQHQVEVTVTDEGVPPGRGARIELGEPKPAPASTLRTLGPGLGSDAPGGGRED